MSEFEKLKQIISKLRSKDGCPWDREQTHDSLLPFLYEETNEVADTIMRNDLPHLKEELGDLLLQIMLHSEIENENSHFNIDEVIADLSEKLVRRHPHVFGEENADNPAEVIALWEKVKNKEKESSTSSSINNNSILDKVPLNFPPLLRSFKIQKEASKVGFDWKDYHGPLDKLGEEVEELKDAIKTGDKTHIEHEIGDIFFALVNLGKFFDIRGDVACAKANNRFYERFAHVEKRVKESGKKFKEFTLEELDKFWDEAKVILHKIE